MNKSLWSSLFIALAAVVLMWPCKSYAVDYHSIMTTESAYILSLQHSSGAIMVHQDPGTSGTYTVNPYFACIAAMGLLETSAPTSAVKNYVLWHFNHLNYPDYNGLSGTIYDYEIDPNTSAVTSLNKYDSADAYGAVFLELVRRYHMKTSDNELVTSYAGAIGDIAYMIVTLADAQDGLTICRPDYPVKYLMDNSEVVMGLRAASYLLGTVVGDTNAGNYYAAWADTVAYGIDTYMWGAGSGPNAWYASRQGSNNDPFAWTTFYPDAAANLYPLSCRVWPASASHVSAAYSGFNAAWPNWPQGGIGDSFPWAVMAYAASIAGDSSRVDAYLTWAESNYIAAGHPYPWNCMDAGFTILAAATTSVPVTVSQISFE